MDQPDADWRAEPGPDADWRAEPDADWRAEPDADQRPSQMQIQFDVSDAVIMSPIA